MKTVYYINGRKETPYNWNQLLYWCYTNIAEVTWRNSKVRNKYGFYPGTKGFWNQELEELTGKEHIAVSNFFKRFRHNPNDGTWSEGRWKQNFHYEYVQQKTEDGRLTCEWIKTMIFDNWNWIEPVFTPNTYQITDSYGRIVPTCLIKADYLLYKPKDFDRKKEISRFYPRWHRSTNLHWEFRRGPVPGIRSYRNGWWHKFTGNHAGRAAMKRQWFRDEVYSHEIFEEYGITFKMDGKEMSTNHGNGSKGKGWKRTRKEKQWMKADWKKLYEVPYEDFR